MGICFLDFHVLCASSQGLERACDRLRQALGQNTADDEYLGVWGEPSPAQAFGLETPRRSLSVVWESLSLERVKGLCQQAFPAGSDEELQEGLAVAIAYGPRLSEVHMILASPSGDTEKVSVPTTLVEPLLGMSIGQVWDEENEEVMDQVGHAALPSLADKSRLVASLRALAHERQMGHDLPPAAPGPRMGRV